MYSKIRGSLSSRSARAARRLVDVEVVVVEGRLEGGLAAGVFGHAAGRIAAMRQMRLLGGEDVLDEFQARRVGRQLQPHGQRVEEQPQQPLAVGLLGPAVRHQAAGDIALRR